MSRSTHPARRAVAIVAVSLVATLAACRDSVSPSWPAATGAVTPFYDFEIGAAVGDTLDLTSQMIVTGVNEEIRCETDAGHVVETVDGTASLVALALGDAIISCAVIRRDDSTRELENLELTAAYYQVYLRVR